jgi:hypothetical protein
MAAKKNSTGAKEETISDILTVEKGTILFRVIGTSPLILNRMSEKAKHELLMPKGRKNAAERATTLKHLPVDEYRASAYTLKNDEAPTLLALLSTAFKGALRSAALDMPGAKKAQIGRLTYIDGDFVGIFGLPKLFMSITRSADMNKTPDVRTRAIVPAWAAAFEVTYVQPLIKAQAVANLLAAAGITIGVGDWRPEKGAGSYGQFKIVSNTQEEAEFNRIVKAGGRAAQAKALENPVCYDDETTELLSWFEDEKAKRALRGVA